MATTDKRIDAYIAKAQPFAQPILTHIRKLVHTACPDVQETMKWSFPHFDYKGIFCAMASFKQHCSFGFWKQSLMKDPHKLFANDQAAGSMGKIMSMKDLPSDKILIEYIKQAAKLNDDGIKVKPKPKAIPNSTELVVPEYFSKALTKNKKAQTTFSTFSYSHKKEYVEWIIDAKSEETRERRLKQAMVWMTEGKSRNWKYTR
jgi:uncharacterized protein YdeI (YjbR/CyaY-like superfamily)